MKWALSHRSAPLDYDDTFREHQVLLPDETQLRMDFCPFCGAQLPRSLREAWGERLEQLGLEPGDPRIPAEMHDGTWWRKEAREGRSG
jgi:hypothetical protein